MNKKVMPVAGPLVAAASSIGEMKGVVSPESRFLRPNSKWNRHLRAQEKGDTRLWEVAVLFHLRDAFRSGDVWLAHSRRYGDLKQVLVPMIAAQENAKLAVPSNPQDWLADRKTRLAVALKRLARAACNGTIPHGSVEDGTLRIDRLTADVPDGAEALILDLYRRMPSVRITDMLLEVDAALGFTDAFIHVVILEQTQPGELRYAIEAEMPGGGLLRFGTEFMPEGKVLLRHLKQQQILPS